MQKFIICKMLEIRKFAKIITLVLLILLVELHFILFRILITVNVILILLRNCIWTSKLWYLFNDFPMPEQRHFQHDKAGHVNRIALPTVSRNIVLFLALSISLFCVHEFNIIKPPSSELLLTHSWLNGV